MLKIYKENSEDLGFVIGCLFSEAINLTEFNQWVELCISNLEQDNIPLYLFELLDFNDSLAKIYNSIGFVPISNLSEEESLALYGIAYLRKKDIYDPEINKSQALKLLEKHPLVMNRFKEAFPFIEI